MDITDILLSFALSVTGGFIGVMFGVWLTKNYMFNAESIMGMADSVLDYATNTKEGQEKMNVLGKWVMTNLMSGLKGGVSGAMPKTKDVIPMILLGLAQKYLPGIAGQNPPENQQQQSNKQEQADSDPFKH